jgi:hypothetical protein
MILDMSLLGVPANRPKPFALNCLSALQTRRLLLVSRDAKTQLSVYVDGIAACLGGSRNCGELAFRGANTSTLSLSLGLASSKHRRIYAPLAHRVF